MRLPPESPEVRALSAVRRHALEGRLPGAACRLGFEADECAALIAAVGIDEPAIHASTLFDEAAPPLLAPLVALLWAERASDQPWTRLAAGTVASACFGARHLWQDIGLSGRDEVSALLQRHFPRLAAGNTRDLKWKRYLFIRLGEQLGSPELRPPRCDGCDDYAVCFAPAPEGVAMRRFDGQQAQKERGDRTAWRGVDDGRP